MSTRMKKRCSIMWCPWKAKYDFGMMGYYECWFHYGDILWLQFLWDIAWIPIRYFYSFLRYGIHGRGNIINWYKLTWEDFIECRTTMMPTSGGKNE